MSDRKIVLMVGPSIQGKGGISSVIKGYVSGGLFAQWNIEYVTTSKEGGWLLKVNAFISALGRFLFRLAADDVLLVHIHTASKYSFYRKSIFSLVCIISRTPYIIHIHGGKFDEFFQSRFRMLGRRYIQFILNCSSRVFVLSKFWKNAISSFVLDEKIRVIKNSVYYVDDPFLNLGEGQSIFRVLFLGKVARSKGVFDLLHAVKGMSDAGHQCELWVCGEGDLTEAEHLAGSLGVSPIVRILGWLDDSEKREAFRLSSCLCLPSYAEGLPMAMLEAMAAGLPVVVSPVGAIGEVVKDGREGLLVQPGDTQSITQALIRLKGDPDGCVRMSSAARKRIREEFSLEVSLRRLSAEYRDICADDAGGGARDEMG